MPLWNLFRKRKNSSSPDRAIDASQTAPPDAPDAAGAPEPGSMPTSESTELDSPLAPIASAAETDPPTVSTTFASAPEDTQKTKDQTAEPEQAPPSDLERFLDGGGADLVILNEEPPRPRKFESQPAGPPKPEVIISLSHKEIAALARSLWESRGMPPNQDDQLWHEAEDILREKRLMELAKGR